MTTHASPKAAQADHLTDALRKSGALGGGRVATATIVHSFPTLLSQLHRLKLVYEGDAAAAPRHLYLKTDLPGRPGATWQSGPREVAFYETVGAATPPGLLPRCFEAHVASDGAWHLLLEDLTDTHHIATQYPLPPTVAQTEAIVRCRARFQALWWDDPRLGTTIGAWPTDAELDGWLAERPKQFQGFADALGDRLPARRRALYEKLFAHAPKLLQRFRSRKHMTIIQGDAHVWNCFLPKDGAADTARLFDWDGWQPNVGAQDLAYMIAMHWYPDRRQHAEERLLDAFHDELLMRGVKGYDRRALQDDYRLSVLWQTTWPIWMRDAGIPPAIWWGHLERIHLAVDDLGCREFLA